MNLLETGLGNLSTSRERWPDVAVVPRARLRGALVASMCDRAAQKLHIGLSFPDGRRAGSLDPNAPVLRFYRPGAVFRRFAVRGPIGLGEAYQAGDWDTDDLPKLLATMARHLDLPGWQLWLRRHVGPRQPATEDNSPGNAKRNIQDHYDLSNALFALFLDETMTYSCALFEVDSHGRPVASADLLTQAQRRKIKRVLDLAWTGPGTRLLEIGTGWGELSIAAAQRGAYVHTVTLSREQCELAQRRIAAAGCADRVKVELCDYRKIVAVDPEGYDAIVSVEMIEAVGQQYWPTYFATLDRLLARGGYVVLQAITMDHRRMLATRDRYTWIHKYIFPGGLIPSIDAIGEACRRYTSLSLHNAQSFGEHYAETLHLWRRRFTQQSHNLAALGFDETFQRTWRLYLSYCEAGFRTGYIDVNHLVLERSV